MSPTASGSVTPISTAFATAARTDSSALTPGSRAR